MIPTVGDVLDNEGDYYSQVYSLTAMPIDMMVQLDDLGIDYTEINEYELFLLMFGTLKNHDTHLIFDGINVDDFSYAYDEDGKMVLVDPKHDIVIDRKTYEIIASVLRKIHNIEKNTRKPGNDAAKSYMMERERKKLKKKKNRGTESQLDPLIVSMVNTPEFKYDFEGIKELSIYQFNESVRQVINKVDYDKRMIGVYTGNISMKDLKKEELSWVKQPG